MSRGLAGEASSLIRRPYRRDMGGDVGTASSLFPPGSMVCLVAIAPRFIARAQIDPLGKIWRGRKRWKREEHASQHSHSSSSLSPEHPPPHNITPPGKDVNAIESAHTSSSRVEVYVIGGRKIPNTVGAGPSRCTMAIRTTWQAATPSGPLQRSRSVLLPTTRSGSRSKGYRSYSSRSAGRW